MSATTSARSAPRAPARVWKIISSIVTGNGGVVAEHHHAGESPTRTRSTPAASASRALG